MTPNEIAQQLNNWFLEGRGRVTQLPGAAAPSTQKYYKTHKGYDFGVSAGTPIKTEGLEFIGSGMDGGYGQRLAAYDPKLDRTYYFSHLSNVQNTPEGIRAYTGGIPGSYGAGNTTGAHLDVEFAPGRQAFNYSQAVQLPQKANSQPANVSDYLNYYADLARQKAGGKKVVAIGSLDALKKRHGEQQFVKL